MLHIRHRCLVDSCWKDEILHVADDWRHNGARYDTVVLRGGQGAVFFAELLALFALPSHNSTTVHKIGLIRSFMPRSRHRLSGYIQASAQAYTPEFIDLDSCERAALLLPTSTTQSEKTVHDLVDGDIYFRLLHIK